MLLVGEASIPQSISLNFGEWTDVAFRPIGYADMVLEENKDYSIIWLDDDSSTDEELVENVRNQFGEYLPNDFDYTGSIGEIDGIVDIDAIIVSKCANCGAEYTNSDSLWDEDSGWVYCPKCNGEEFWTESVVATVKMNEQPATWTVAMCSSEGDGIDMWRVFGRKEDVKKYMKRLSDDYCDGCDEETLPQKPEDIRERQNGNLYSGPWGSDFHVDIEAKMEEFPENIIANKKAPEDGETASAFNLITADMSNWGHSCPMGIGATRDDDVAPICDYCDGTEDFVAFLERNAERISSSTELQFIIDSDEADRCLDAVKEIKKCFERLKEDSKLGHPIESDGTSF